jgi:Uncharacterised nucleotidyltransferase
MRRLCDAGLLLRVLIRPAVMAELTEPEWEALLPRARACHLLARLAAAARAGGFIGSLPHRIQDHLAAVATVAAHHQRTIRWEINRIQRALRNLDVPVVLLKGAAYLAAGLPAARGRLVGDVDIMVPRHALDAVERALEGAGWQPTIKAPYSQRYYRRWMHELPPLRHRDRATIIDVHHTILPRTARLKPHPDELWALAQRLDGSPLRVLAPTDMVLHAAAHLFHDGDLRRSLRDLVDISDLLTYFAERPAFWPSLAPRAAVLHLGRPLFYALRYCRCLLRTPIPEAVISAALRYAPPQPVVAAMDRLVPDALLAGGADSAADRNAAAMLLYLRSHWLRMPPWLLVPHLARQAIARASQRRE